jgi:hypothetical protein
VFIGILSGNDGRQPLAQGDLLRGDLWLVNVVTGLLLSTRALFGLRQ